LSLNIKFLYAKFLASVLKQTWDGIHTIVKIIVEIPQNIGIPGATRIKINYLYISLDSDIHPTAGYFIFDCKQSFKNGFAQLFQSLI